MDLSWNFFKIILQNDQSFEQRQKELIKRFTNADTFTKRLRGTNYHYQLYDVEALDQDKPQRKLLIGRLTRSPKLARGRRLDSEARKSVEGEVDVEEIADATEFIYDLDSCVLSLHRRAPFTGLNTVARVWSQLLGVVIKQRGAKKITDVHVDILRDPKFVDQQLDSAERLIEVKLKYAKPNPGSGDDSLRKIHLGLIGEDIEADEVTFNARRLLTGSLEKAKNGFIRRSIKTLLENGYLKRGLLRVGATLINVLEAKEKTRETSGYERDSEGEPLTLRQNAAKWVRQLLSNEDIFPPKEHGR